MNLRPTKSKFKVAKVDMSALKKFGSNIDENILLMNSADTMKDYDDLTYLSRKAATMFNKSLSQMKTPFNDFLQGKSAVHYTENNFVRWRTYGDPDNRCMFLEDVTGTSYPGLGKLPFNVKVDTDMFLPGAIMSPLLDKTIKFRVLEHGVKSGGGWIYLVELITDDEHAYVPLHVFAEGTYVMQMGAAYGEASKDLAGMQFMFDLAYVEFEVPMIQARWKFEVTNEAQARWGNLILGEVSTSKDGISNWVKGKTKISGWLEAQAFAQIKWEQELWDTYGNVSETLIDRSSSKFITTSPGMFEYLENGANIFTYNPNNSSIDQLENRLEAVWFDRVDPSEQSIVLYTGKGGIKTFHQWVLDKYGQEAVLGTYDFVLKQGKSFHNGNTDGYTYAGYQFTQYNLPTWGVVSVAHFPTFDNTKINLVKAPNGLYPASSYEFLAFNVKIGDTNVRKLKRNGYEHSGYVCGMTTPLGPAGPNNPMKPSHTGLFYTWGYGDSWGLQIEDVHSMLWLRPSFG